SAPKVIPFRKREEAEERASRVGMGAFLVAWTMHFGALLLMYAFTRWLLRAPEIFPMPEPPCRLPLASTLVTGACSVVLESGKRGIAQGKRARLEGALGTTLVLGLSFVALQAVLYSQLLALDIGFGRSAQTAVFWGLHWAHVAHVLVGI